MPSDTDVDVEVRPTKTGIFKETQTRMKRLGLNNASTGRG